MKKIITSILLVCSIFSMAQKPTTDAKPEKVILINNVQIFNGKDEKLTTGNVLIVNNLISKIAATPIATNKSGNTIIIDGKGKVLMPGLIDAHTHIMMESLGIM